MSNLASDKLEKNRKRSRDYYRNHCAKDPEYRKRISERNRKRYANDPEFRRKTNERGRKYYNTHKKRARELSDAKKVSNMKFVEEIKKGSKCSDCGYNEDWRVLEFDHVKGEKLAGVSYFSNSGATLKRIIDEIAKCEIVCANCHRIRTYDRKGFGIIKG